MQYRGGNYDVLTAAPAHYAFGAVSFQAATFGARTWAGGSDLSQESPASTSTSVRAPDLTARRFPRPSSRYVAVRDIPLIAHHPGIVANLVSVFTETAPAVVDRRAEHQWSWPLVIAAPITLVYRYAALISGLVSTTSESRPVAPPHSTID